MGRMGGGGPPGDLWATIRIRPHPVFRREGRNLYLEAPIGIGEAIRGAKIEIPTLEGRATLTVRSGRDDGRTAARGGTQIDLRQGAGMPIRLPCGA